MDAYMTPDVANWAKRAKVTHKMLSKAAEEVSKGLVDANHRYGLFKKRIATRVAPAISRKMWWHKVRRKRQRSK